MGAAHHKKLLDSKIQKEGIFKNGFGLFVCFNWVTHKRNSKYGCYSNDIIEGEA